MRRLAMGTALGAGLLIAGCGTSTTSVGSSPSSAAHPGATTATVQVRCASTRVTVPLGGRLELQACPAGVTARATDAKLVQVSATAFTAAAPGLTAVSLTDRPSCSAGTLCPQYVRDLGEISVTVSAASGS